MSHKPSSKPYKNSDFIRTLVSTQLLMELNLSEFVKSNQTIKLSKNYSLNKYSKDLDKTWIELLCMGEFDGEWNKNTFNEFISPIERQEGSKVILENNTAIAATFGPGLIGGLIVGSSFAKGLSISKNIKLIPINHLQAHLLSPRLVSDIKFPYLCLLVSGGNTALVLVKSSNEFITLGSTIDDSAGECFDKVAKGLGLGYPGGPEIEKLAFRGNNKKFKLPMPLTKKTNCDFSFSGLKTSALDVIRKNKKTKIFLKDFSASFQHTISKVFEIKIFNSLAQLKRDNISINDFSICGGVAANKYLIKQP